MRSLALLTLFWWAFAPGLQAVSLAPRFNSGSITSPPGVIAAIPHSIFSPAAQIPALAAISGVLPAAPRGHVSNAQDADRELRSRFDGSFLPGRSGDDAEAEPIVGIYGRTFDPVHLGHLAVIDRAMEAKGLSSVVVFPRGSPTGKSGAQPFAVRWKLLKAAVKERPDIIVPPAKALRSILKSADAAAALKSWVMRRFPKGARVYHLIGGTAPEYLSRRYRADPLLNEALLPRRTAEEIKRGGYYARSDARGYHDLPADLVGLVDYEQTLNERIENVSAFTSIKEDNQLSPRYMPEKRPIYELHTVELPLEEAEIVAAEALPAQLIFTRKGKRYVRFFVHPESESFFRKRLRAYRWTKEYLATPTSSHRSLVAWNPNNRAQPLGVKVSLDVSIGQVVRLVTRKQIEQAVGVSALVKSAEKEMAERGIRFMPEPAGIMPRNFGYGYLLRRYPANLPPGTKLIPMFSLYSKPARGPPMIVELARKSGLPIKRFVEEFLIAPMVGQAAYMAFQHGLVGEPHEQNVLIEVRDGTPTKGFWYRDLSGFWIDKRLRKAAGKDMSFLPGAVTWKEGNDNRGPFAGQMRTYLLESNFYALREALAPYFPEISEAWMAKTFRRAMSQAERRYSPG